MIDINGRLHSTEKNVNVVAGADEILDDTKNKKQSDINTETYALVNEINAKLATLSPEQQSALSVATKANKNEANLGYYVCDTEANVAAKIVANATGYMLAAGGSIKIKMNNTNDVTNATLNINSTGGRLLYYNGKIASATNTWEAGETVEVYFDGDNYYANNVSNGGKFSTGEKISDVGIDDEPTADSENLVKSGGVQNELALGAVYDVSAKNPTAGPNNNGKWESLSALLSDVNLNTLIPTAVRRGGMGIKFIQSSDNKYVQYFLTKDEWSVSEADWQKMNLKEEVSQLSLEIVTKRTGRNLFDYSAAELNKRLGASGGLVNDTNYLVTDYIPVVEGENYYISDVVNSLATSQYICFFSPQKAFVSSEHYTSTTHNIVTVPTGCAYMRCTIYVASLTKLQIEKGNKRGDYLPYTKIGGYVPDVDVQFVYDSAIADNAIGNANILDKSISAEKVSFIKSINLLNKNDANVSLSKYINPSSGLLANNTGYNTTGYIRVESGETYYFGSTDAQNNANFYCLFDRNFSYVSGGSSVPSVTIPNGVFFIRFSISTSAWSEKKAQMTADSLKPYSEYELKLDVPVETFKPCINALGQSGFSKTFASTLSSGDLFQLEDYPYFQLKGIVMSFSCELTLFSSLVIGKGYQKRLGEYIQIDGTNVQLITCDLSGNETIRDTSAHGLTISDFLRVSFAYMGDGQVQYVISTKSGVFNKTLSWRYIGEYEPFVKSIGTTATGVKLSIGSTDLKKSIWAFGDSYMSISSERWPGVLNTMGLLNIMVNALSGINSTNMIIDAQKAFAFGSPLFAIWGLGMNDASDEDSGTPASTWVTAIETFIALCKANDTEPILATIPCIPSKNHEGKNAWVRASGYRYIDFAKAVNGQTYTSGSSNWYDGMLSTDNVHPTAVGAQALASQLLQDLPEIMQINH